MFINMFHIRVLENVYSYVVNQQLDTDKKRFILFYVLLTVHPCIISQISPTRCTILFNIFIYLCSLHVSGIHVPIIRRKIAVSLGHWYLSLCMRGVWSAGWISVQPAD